MIEYIISTHESNTIGKEEVTYFSYKYTKILNYITHLPNQIREYFKILISNLKKKSYFLLGHRPINLDDFHENVYIIFACHETRISNEMFSKVHFAKRC